MDTKYARKVVCFVGSLFSMSMMFGCANYEVNTKRGDIPGHYIRYEMQEADRAVETARQAGKDKACPAEFAAAEDAKNKAYDVFRACHTEEGAALAKQATAKTNALCPPSPKTEAKPEPAPVAVAKPRAEEPVVILAAEPMVEEKVIVGAVEPKVVVLAFEDVHFDFDQSTLKSEAKTILKRNIQLLKENPKAQIRVAGYTSASGTEAYNQKLSERRADAVRAYLVSEGVIASDRLSTIGYGETHPAVYEAAPKELYSAAAKANIRVLFEIIVK
jgi:outer membrane protein OmpA-like peptidoglycan-associated protein